MLAALDKKEVLLMFADVAPGSKPDIGRLNIEAARALARQRGLAVAAEDVGGTRHRRLSFDVSDGRVWVWHGGEPAGAR
jgi:chemotaxis receptor (MCP) glutamine deamidase CheD